MAPPPTALRKEKTNLHPVAGTSSTKQGSCWKPLADHTNSKRSSAPATKASTEATDLLRLQQGVQGRGTSPQVEETQPRSILQAEAESRI